MLINETQPVKLGDILLRARSKRRWNLPEAAKRLGVVKSQVLCWERGDYLPRKTNLVTLARVYALSYERLVRIAAAERYS